MKKTLFVVTLIAIAAAIWYLEGLRAHPGAGGAPQAINIPAAGNASTAVAQSEVLNMIATADQKAGYQPAIEIADPTGFINASSTFRLSSLIGKNVILLDFWTYSCVNCVRTLPSSIPAGMLIAVTVTSRSAGLETNSSSPIASSPAISAC